MTVTLNLPPQVESELIAAAQSRGVPVDELLAEILLVSRTRNVVTGAALVEAGRRSPYKDTEIEPERFPISQVRDVNL